MNYDDAWPDENLEIRRQKVRQTIRPVTYTDLKLLGEKRFVIVTDPWFEKFNQFLDEHKNAKFYMAESPESAEIIYCRDTGNGIWFLPGKGMGIIQPKGLQMLAEIVDQL
jgi:hypothetical protein